VSLNLRNLKSLFVSLAYLAKVLSVLICYMVLSVLESFELMFCAANPLEVFDSLKGHGQNLSVFC
jgi:hypothetical protein